MAELQIASPYRTTPISARSGITPASILLVLLLLDALLLLAEGSATLFVSRHHSLTVLSLEAEGTVGAWYAGSKYLVIATLLSIFSFAVRDDGRPDWAILAAAFVFLVMSCDEPVGFHELLQAILHNDILLKSSLFGGDATVIAKVLVGSVGLIVATGAVIAVLRGFSRYPASRTSFVLGFLLLAMGAFGVDLLKEYFPPSPGTQKLIGDMIEEAFEKSGATMLVFGALQALCGRGTILEFGPRMKLHRGAFEPGGDSGDHAPSSTFWREAADHNSAVMREKIDDSKRQYPELPAVEGKSMTRLIDTLFKGTVGFCLGLVAGIWLAPTFYARYAADFPPQVYEGLLKQAIACP